MKEICTLLVCAAALTFTAAFGEDAYIESDGSTGAGINTGFFFGPQSKVEIDFQLTTDEANTMRLFGAAGASGNDAQPEGECYIGSNSAGTQMFSFICAKQGARQSSNFKAIDTQRHRIVLDFYEAKEFQVWTGSSKSAKALSDYPANRQLYPLAFFCKNYTTAATYTSKNTSFHYPAKMRVYSFKIWDAGVLVRDYTPCVKGGRAGFKENCSGRFVSGENTRAFTAGGDVPFEKDDPYIWSPRNIVGTSGVENNIYLDTGYTVLPTTRVELDYAMITNTAVGSPWASEPYLLTSSTTSDGSGNKNMSFATQTNGWMKYSIGSSSLRDITCLDTAFNYDVRRTVSMNSNSIAIITAGYTNYTDIVSASQAFSSAHTVPRYTLRIGCNYAGTGRYLPMKIYGIKIFESDVLVKDYVPFVTNGVGGMRNSLNTADAVFSTTRINYSDTVNDGVRTNVCFDVGGDIACTDGSDEAYLEFDGKNTHSFNTGYVVTKDSCIEVDYSLWNTKYNSQQFIFEQADRGRESSTNDGDGIWARVYYGSTFQLSYSFCDYVKGGHFKSTGVTINNARTQLKLDSYNNVVSVYNDGVKKYEKQMNNGYSYSRTKTTCATNLWIGSDWDGTAHAASMRLYNFKVSEAGAVVRNYVPCVRNGQAGLYDLVNNTFAAVVGGKVSGATLKGQGFQIAPVPATLTKCGSFNTATLTCLAAGAQSSEWYEDDVLMSGETADSLTLTWVKTKAKPDGHTHTYSVKPVYIVFNEKVVGEPVTAMVEYTPLGTIICVQ